VNPIITQVDSIVNLDNAVTSFGCCVNRSFTGKLDHNSLRWGVYNRSFKAEVLDVGALAAVIQSGYSVAPIFHTSRHSDNFMSAQILGLDFDQSSFADLRGDRHIADYAAILHTTTNHRPDAPRTRALFILDQPIYDAAQYADYARAFAWFHRLADQQCTDAARAWFGAVGCEIEIDGSKVLPIAVLDSVLAEYNEAHRHPATLGVEIDGAPEKFLHEAVQAAKLGTRHDTGFKLFRQLRDLGLNLDTARVYAESYQITVEKLGNHPYTWQEAWASLRGAYSRKPARFIGTTLDQTLADFEQSVWESRDLPKSSRHYILKTAMGISQIAERSRKATDLYLPTRSFSEFGVSDRSASAHLKVLTKLGLLSITKKADKRDSGRYTITVTDTGSSEPTQSTDIALSPIYKQLQPMPHFEYGAKIDPRMCTEHLSDGTLGPTALRVIAVLATIQNKSTCDKPSHTEELHSISFPVCETLSHLNTMSDLWRLAGITSRSGERCYKTLVELGICTWEYSPIHASRKLPSLTENWYERLITIEPILTTYGKKEKRNLQNDKQRELHHAALANYGNQDERTKSANLSIAASERQKHSQSALDAVNARKAAILAKLQSTDNRTNKQNK